MKLTTKQGYTLTQANCEAYDILTEEANQLALYLDQQTLQFPHRVNIAISREIQRLRAIADTFKEDDDPR